ncbi:hypothetical protein CK222_21645 [Mesorhizobium sp. WSM3866]|uniref:hypothetical protein n=1 Tax=Mesorhizobium sp. WSM3866 TaxID=422271 RepID=UPI000BAEB133|nr:hypothetical protein [Mesorhizobium sp. WSM3866]PBB41762.1 hypothetical protein CK222_21645 [Mesorhizobium sp. WSM3866]
MSEITITYRGVEIRCSKEKFAEAKAKVDKELDSGKPRYIVWREDKNEGFVTLDKQLANHARKGADSNCYYPDGTLSHLAVSFCLLTGDEICTTEVSPTYADAVAPYAAAIRMIREAVEEIFGPAANLESEEAVLLRGPEPHHDAEAIIAALQRVAERRVAPEVLAMVVAAAGGKVEVDRHQNIQREIVTYEDHSKNCIVYKVNQ